MGIALRAEHILTEHEDNVPRLPGRIQMFKGSRALIDKTGQQHYMSLVRKAVMSSPAARTILGTSDALVMPGIVLTSRK